MLTPSSLAQLRFPDAAEIWLEFHQRHIQLGSVRDYKQCIKSLSLFFANLKLSEIHIGHFEQYQKQRLSGVGLSKAGPSRVNHELNTLAQILTRANLWGAIAPYYEPLPLPKDKVIRIPTEQEAETLFQVARSKKKWRVALYASIITTNTTCNAGEIRNLRLMDLELAPSPNTPFGSIRIVLGAKNQYRNRIVPLNPSAAFALRQLRALAAEHGADNPEHFLIPHRAPKGQKGWDATRPATSWRKAFNKLRSAAKLPWLQMHHLRHYSITKLLENEAIPERAVIELAGHVSRKMLDLYSHIRLQSKLDAVLRLEKNLPEPQPEAPKKQPERSPVLAKRENVN